MVVRNFVDEIIPDWQLQLEETHRITVRSTIVYRLPVSQVQFNRAATSLEARQAAFADELTHLAERKGKLRVIDHNTTLAARQSLSKKLGESFLDKFIYDTERAIVPELGNAVRRINGRGVKTFPERAGAAISVSPARSFRSTADLARFEQKRGSTWSPTVRLEVIVDLEGPREMVELSVDDIRTAMLFCGPITSFTESAAVPHHYDEPAMRLPLAAP
jgi:hypothetical protein